MIPSVSQLIEQIVRVASVYVIYRIQMRGTDSRDARHCGMGNCLWGDFLCSLFCRCRALFQATAL